MKPLEEQPQEVQPSYLEILFGWCLGTVLVTGTVAMYSMLGIMMMSLFEDCSRTVRLGMLCLMLSPFVMVGFRSIWERGSGRTP